MISAWSHLPNAPHIDDILSHLKKNPKKWYHKQDDTFLSAYLIAGKIAYDIDAAACAAATISTSAYTSTSGVIFALIAYDDCAYLLNEKPEDVKMLALLGNPAAILLYSACVAMQEELV